MKKRGLSGVIVTLLMIVISITAIVIVWAVIKNIVESGSEDIGLGQYTIDLKVQKVVQSTNSADITIKRNTGQGTLSGLKFIVSDGINKQTFEQKNINFNELETKSFTIPYSSLIKTIEVAPIISIQGKESLQNVVETFDLPATDVVKNMPGLVSWYRFEGDANDEMGRNNGVVFATTSVSGKYGKAYSFKINGDKINIPDNTLLQLENSNMTLMFWVYPGSGNIGNYAPLFSKGFRTSPGYSFITEPTNNPTFGANNTRLKSNINITNDVWTHLTGTQNYITSGNRITRIYINGGLNKEMINLSSANPTSVGRDIEIGASSSYGNFPANATVDEVMIFNKTLTDQEIQAIYKLDLS